MVYTAEYTHTRTGSSPQGVAVAMSTLIISLIKYSVLSTGRFTKEKQI